MGPSRFCFAGLVGKAPGFRAQGLRGLGFRALGLGFHEVAIRVSIGSFWEDLQKMLYCF